MPTIVTLPSCTATCLNEFYYLTLVSAPTRPVLGSGAVL